MYNEIKIKVKDLKEWYDNYFYVDSNLKAGFDKKSDFLLAQNLNISWEKYIEGVKQNNGFVIEKYCYFNNSNDCKNFINNTLSSYLTMDNLIEA